MRKSNFHWVLLAYAALAILLTYPLVFRMTQLMLANGAGEDTFIFVWNIWWLKKALLDLHTNPYITDFIFYPDGTNLALHTFPLAGSLLGVALSFFRPGIEGLFVAYNLVILVSFFLTAIGAYLLVLRLTGTRSAAFVSGLVFAFTHYRFCNLARLHCLETGVLAFAVWALVGMVQEKKIRWGLAVGLFSAILLYSSMEYFAYLLIGIFFAIVYLSIRSPSRIWNRKMAAPKIAGGATFVVLSLPLLWALVSHGFGGEARATAHAGVFSADVLDALVPNPLNPLFGDWSRVIERELHGGQNGFGLALPLTALILAIWALVTGNRSRTWPWGGLGISYFLLSLGPVIHVGGHETGIPSLYRGLAALVPWFEISRTPMRAIVGVQLVLAILTGYALAPELRTTSRSLTVALVATVLLIFETLSIPLPMTRLDVHPFYQEIAGSPENGAVLDLPPQDRAALLHPMIHGRKIPAVRRVYPRSPARSLTFWESRGFHEFLDTLFRPEKMEDLTPGSRALLLSNNRGLLSGRGFRFVVLEKTAMPPAMCGQALSVLWEMAPVRALEDDRMAVFQF